MLPIRTSWQLKLLGLVLGALCTATFDGAEASSNSNPGLEIKDVLSDALLASPPGSARSVATEDLYDEPLAQCTPRGPIENAQCNYEQVDAINKDFYEQLQAIVQTPYFRYYKTDLDKTCPYWPDDALCTNRNCAVETLDEAHIPEKYRTSTLSSVSTTPEEIVAHLSGSTGAPSCHCDDADFCHWDDEYSPKAVFVDLTKNPERFTGYSGGSAGRIWKSIYDENCFGVPGKVSGSPAQLASSSGVGVSADTSLYPAASQAFASFLSAMQPGQQREITDEEDEGGVCLEKRVFYRIVSGLHASISIHICNEFLDKETGVWGPNEKCFRFRIANYPDRLQNLYFDYVLFLRALARVGEQAAQQTDFRVTSDGNEIDDEPSQLAFSRLLRSARQLTPVFDEKTMFSGPDAAGLRDEVKHRFRNITTIMDCVGCDKCRLWGKLQTSGVATALKILFAYDEQQQSQEQDDAAGTHHSLKRSELVALVNTANRFAESLKAVERFRAMYQRTLGAVARGRAEDEAGAGPGQAEDVSAGMQPPEPPGRTDTRTLHDDL